MNYKMSKKTNGWAKRRLSQLLTLVMVLSALLPAMYAPVLGADDLAGAENTPASLLQEFEQKAAESGRAGNADEAENNGITQAQRDEVEAILKDYLEGTGGRIIGFDDSLLSSSEDTDIIVIFKSLPAEVARKIDADSGRTQLLRSVNYEQRAEADRTIFQDGLNDIFGGRSRSAAGYKIRAEYNVGLNGVAMTVPANRIKELAEISSVAAIYPDAVITLDPNETQISATQAAAMQRSGTSLGMDQSRKLLGIDELHQNGIKGDNVIVGVVDTGIDYNHPDLANAFLDYVPNQSETGGELINGKFYGWNFINLDGIDRHANDPMETTFDEWKKSGKPLLDSNGNEYYNTHGTHVSSEIVANPLNTASSLPLLGIAPNAKVIAYRVLGAYGSGNESGVLSAMEQTVKDGCDIVNMSLGNSSQSPTQTVALMTNTLTYTYDITFCVSAGNDGSAAHTVTSPGTADLAVVSGANSAYEIGRIRVDANGSEYEISRRHDNPNNDYLKDSSGSFYYLTYPDAVHDGAGKYPVHFLKTTGDINAPIGKYDDLSIGSDNAIADWEAAKNDVAGKFVVVVRGGIFIETAKNAKKYGAAGIILINNESGDSLDQWIRGKSDEYVPMFTMPYSSGENFLDNVAADNMKLKFSFVDVADDESHYVAPFSGRGPVGDKTYGIKPDVTNVGVFVYGAAPYFAGFDENSIDVPDYSEAYQPMSGTSMASPHTAGVAALILSQHKANSSGKMTSAELRARIMNNARTDFTGGLYDYGVLDIGSGLPNTKKSIENSCYVTVKKENVPITDDNDSIIRRLGQTASLSYGGVNPGTGAERTLTARIFNTSSSSKTFNVTAAFNNKGTLVKYSSAVEIIPEQTTFTVPAGTSTDIDITMKLPGSVTELGSYEGYVTFDSGTESMHLPFSMNLTDDYLGKDHLLDIFATNPIISTNDETKQNSYSNESDLCYAPINPFDVLIASIRLEDDPYTPIGLSKPVWHLGNYFPYPDREYILEEDFFDGTAMMYDPETGILGDEFINLPEGHYVYTFMTLGLQESTPYEDTYNVDVIIDNKAPALVDFSFAPNGEVRGQVYDEGMEYIKPLGITPAKDFIGMGYPLDYRSSAVVFYFTDADGEVLQVYNDIPSPADNPDYDGVFTIDADTGRFSVNLSDYGYVAGEPIDIVVADIMQPHGSCEYAYDNFSQMFHSFYNGQFAFVAPNARIYGEVMPGSTGDLTVIPTPENDSSIGFNGSISLDFNKSLDRSTVTTENIRLENTEGESVPSVLSTAQNAAYLSYTNLKEGDYILTVSQSVLGKNSERLAQDAQFIYHATQTDLPTASPTDIKLYRGGEGGFVVNFDSSRYEARAEIVNSARPVVGFVSRDTNPIPDSGRIAVKGINVGTAEIKVTFTPKDGGDDTVITINATVLEGRNTLTIASSGGGRGTIANGLSSDVIEPGEDVVFYPLANNGYVLRGTNPFEGSIGVDVDNITEVGEKAFQFVMPDRNVTIMLNFIKQSGGSGGSGGRLTNETPTEDKNAIAEVPVAQENRIGIKGKSGATEEISTGKTPFVGSIDAEEAAQMLAAAQTNGGAAVVSLDLGDAGSITLKAQQLADLGKEGKRLSVSNAAASVTIPTELLLSLGGNNAPSDDITIVMNCVGSVKLSEDALKENSRNRDLMALAFELKVMVNGKELNHLGSQLPVSIDTASYNLTKEQQERLTAIIIYPDGSYDQIGGEMLPSGLFQFYTDKTGTFALIISQDLVKIELAVNNEAYVLNGTLLDMDAAPVIKDGRTLVPLRFVAEALGAEVSWDENTRTANISLDGQTMQLKADALMPGMSIAPTIQNGRLLIPLRYVSESFGANVVWVAESKEILIYR